MMSFGLVMFDCGKVNVLFSIPRSRSLRSLTHSLLPLFDLRCVTKTLWSIVRHGLMVHNTNDVISISM